MNACFLLQTTKLSQAGESDSGNIQTIQTEPTKAGATNAKSSSRLMWRLFTCAAAFAAPRTRYLTSSVNIGVCCAAHTKPAAAIVARAASKGLAFLHSGLASERGSAERRSKGSQACGFKNKGAAGT